MVRIAKLTLVIDERDREAFLREYEAHLMRYGDNPAPHLRAEAARDRNRIFDVFRQCWEVDTISAPITS